MRYQAALRPGRLRTVATPRLSNPSMPAALRGRYASLARTAERAYSLTHMAQKSSPGTAPRRSDPATGPVGLLRERLLDREEQLRTAQEMAEFGIWEWDIPSGSVTWSGHLHTIYGTDP